MAEHIVYHNFRLNLDNADHAAIDQMLSQLYMESGKSKNQVILDIMRFYMEHRSDDLSAGIDKADIKQEIKVELLEELVVLMGRTFNGTGRGATAPEQPTIRATEEDATTMDLVASWG